MKNWILYKLGRISEQEYRIRENLRLGVKIDKLRAKRAALKEGK